MFLISNQRTRLIPRWNGCWTLRWILTDNGVGYRSACGPSSAAQLAIKHSRTRPYRPATNGKVERFNRTLLDEWAFARL
jgi:transposase InsO family protein